MTQTAPAPAPAKKEAATSRVYLILRVLDTTPQTLERVGNATASSDRTAVRQAVKEHGYGTYVAVPERAWHQHTVEVEKIERTRWS